MKYKASEVIKNAFTLSQLGDTSAFNWSRKVTLLNSSFCALWDKVINSSDDFIVSRVYLHNNDFLPEDLYSIRALRDVTRNAVLERVRDRELPDTESYRIINNILQTKADLVELEYYRSPPTITIPNEVINLTGTNYKIDKGTLVKKELGNYTIINLDLDEADEFTGIANVKQWDYLGNLLVELDTVNNLYINGILISENVEYFVKDIFIEYKIINNNNNYRVLYDGTSQVIDKPAGSYTVNDSLYRFNNGFLQTWINNEWTNVSDTLFTNVLFANPYILTEQNGAWFNFFENTRIVLGAGKIISASWDEITGYGLVKQFPGKMELHSFYPDTELDYPNSLYFDWLEAAIALDAKKQVEQNTQYLEQIAEQRWARLLSQMSRNRADSFKIRNPYSIRG